MRLRTRLALAALAFGILVMGAGYWQATRPPTVVRIALPLPGLEDDVRILLLSDLHGGLPEMPRHRIEAIVGQVNGLRPDLILLAGDYHTAKLFDWPGSFPLEQSLEPLRALSAPLGVFAVRGNHDNVWTNRVLARAPSPRLLINAAVDVGPFVVAGVDSSQLNADLAGTLARVPPGRAIVVVLHEPEQVLYAAATRPALVLAGHTHGGQIWFGERLGSPTEWFSGSRFACRRGACRINGWQVFVTSGLGTSWLPLRWGVPPEMVLITLQGATGRNSGTERYRSPVS